MVEAYGQLAAEGYLHARTGYGTEVVGAQALPPASPRPSPHAQPETDFRLGRPNLGSFPRAAWIRALRRALQLAPDAALGPGDGRGTAELRLAVAAYAGRARGVVTDPERVVVCSGFIQVLRLTCEVLRRRGAGWIALEDPCLPDHRQVARAVGLDVVPLSVDEHGARADLLPAGSGGAVVLTPAHQALLGATLSPQRRAEFVRWATATDGIVLEDDYDGEFRYEREPIGALQELAPERVVYAGTASKMLAPGVRLAWAAVPSELLEAFAEAKRHADRGSGVLDQMALTELIASGALDRHVRRMRLRYRRRRDAVVQVLRRHAPDWRLLGMAAGLHVAAILPEEGPSEQALLAAARRAAVAVSPLRPFWHDPAGRPQGIVLGYGTPPDHAFEAALGRLAGLLDSLR